MASVALLLALFIPLISSQLSQSPSNGSKLLRFVAQLNINGCTIFVHDTGAPGGPHLAVEPLMCVTESLHNVLPRFDPVTQQIYVSVAVMLSDNAMLAEVQRQLRHLSPKSVKFAAVSDISVSTDASSVIQALGFDWAPEEATGVLRVGCKGGVTNCSGNVLQFGSLQGQLTVLNSVLFAVSLAINNGALAQLTYRLVIQNQSLFDSSLWGQTDLPTCKQLRFVKSIKLNNCFVRVHQRMDMKGNFLIEPLLCYKNSTTAEPVKYDHIRAIYYLNLDVVLQDDIALDAVNVSLVRRSPLSVTFMRVWKVQSQVASALSGRLEISELMVSGDKKSGQVRVYCGVKDQCTNLREAIDGNPFRLWRYIKWKLTSEVVNGNCIVVSYSPVYASAFSLSAAHDLDKSYNIRHWWKNLCKLLGLRIPGATLCYPEIRPQNRQFVVIQQRTSARISFQQSWLNYENGFGSTSDYWIGLSTIHSLSASGATLRVEMTLLNGTERHAEYADFKVGDASTNYQMSYREMLWGTSNVGFDAMEQHNGMQFSTMDKDNDGGRLGSCSELFGRGGWWFNDCHHFNPNGLFPVSQGANYSHVGWREGSQWLLLRQLRLMIQI